MSEGRRQCPVCKLPDQKVVATRDYGDKVGFDCARCGRFEMSRTAECITDSDVIEAQLSGWLRERNILGVEIPLLTSTLLKSLVDELPNYGPLEKQRRLLKAIEALTDHPGKEVILIPEQSVSLAWAENEVELKYYVDSLIERGLIEISSSKNRSTSDPLYPVRITARGWEYIENDLTEFSSKVQAFVAMSFDPALLPIFENAIAPAIDSNGYKPYRVDAEPHLDRIDAKIISEIRNSRFLVADVTQQKSGVYYEAGFAHGLGIPVIWCVQRDDLKNVHFDTRQYGHVLWEEEAELREKLSDYISATIGARVT